LLPRIDFIGTKRVGKSPGLPGLDVNGWRDVAARDWDPDEDPNEQAQQSRILDGGLGSVAVRQNSDDWIGGPQALLAPHARGVCSGDIGHAPGIAGSELGRADLY
jgi:hypothetical protein